MALIKNWHVVKLENNIKCIVSSHTSHGAARKALIDLKRKFIYPADPECAKHRLHQCKVRWTQTSGWIDN